MFQTTEFDCATVMANDTKVKPVLLLSQKKNNTIQHCRKIRPCGINGCSKLHNRLLHKSEEPKLDIKNARNEKKKQIKEQTAKVSTSEKKENQRTLIVESALLECAAMRTVSVLLANGKQKLQGNALLDHCSMNTF